MAGLSQEEKIASLQPDFQGLLDARGVDAVMQAALFDAGIPSIAMLSAVATDRDALLEVARAELGIDIGARPRDAIKFAALYLSWQSAVKRRVAMDELDADATAHKQPKAVPGVEMQLYRAEFEKRFFKLKDAECPGKPSFEDVCEQLDSGEFRPMALRHFGSRAEEDDAETGSLHLGKAGLTPFTAIEYLNYICSKNVAQLESLVVDEVALHRPSLKLIMSYEFQMRKEAVEQVNKGDTWVTALREVVKNADVRERFFSTPLAVTSAMQSIKEDAWSKQRKPSGIPETLEKLANSANLPVKVTVDAFDVLRDAKHDLLDDGLQKLLLDRIAQGYYDAALMSSPCGTWETRRNPEMMGILNPKMEKRHDPKMRDITKGIILEIHEGIQPKVRDIINPKMKGILRDLVKGIILEILKVTIIIMSNLKGSLSQFQELLLTLQENLVDGVKVFLKGTLVLILKGILRALKNGGVRARWAPIEVWYKGRARRAADGLGLNSPGIRPSGHRGAPRSSAAVKLQETFWQEVMGFVNGMDKRARLRMISELALGRFSSSPFQGFVAGLKALDSFGVAPQRKPGDRRSEIHFRRLRAWAEVVQDPDSKFLEGMASTGVPLGTRGEIPWVSAVYDKRERKGSEDPAARWEETDFQEYRGGAFFELRMAVKLAIAFFQEMVEKAPMKALSIPPKVLGEIFRVDAMADDNGIAIGGWETYNTSATQQAPDDLSKEKFGNFSPERRMEVDLEKLDFIILKKMDFETCQSPRVRLMQAEDVTDRTDGWSLGERLGVDNKAQESAKDEEHSFSNRRAKLLLVAMRTSAVTMGVAELGDPEVLGQPGEQVSALSRRPELPDTQGSSRAPRIPALGLSKVSILGDMISEAARMVFTGILAVTLVALGAWYGVEDREQTGRQEEIVAVEESSGLHFVLFGSLLLTVLYFFMKYLIWVLLAVFACGAVSATAVLLEPAFASCLPALRKKKACVLPQSLADMIGIEREHTWTDVFSESIGAALAVSFLIWRNNDTIGWLFQDIIAIAFLLTLQRTVRLPNLKVGCLLLICTFFFDIFWVFLSPLIFKKSVMIEVATGGGTGQAVPMVLKIPALQGDLPGQFKILGLGDIAIPGLLISLLLRHDLVRKHRRCRGYFLAGVIGYAIGLLATFVQGTWTITAPVREVLA
ncbi:Signal peptide peptidase-like 2B (SPP-like 2B) (SPPL2b) [Durusdinium trenchii]|uniref:Signal peptide peptidase-like 2B (SPP-like 2B) (SPPL2b) n=1 Tax=Durusdinium trenchii TaxID=1381693 RepID=A0ABP0MBM3_9DINO